MKLILDEIKAGMKWIKENNYCPNLHFNLEYVPCPTKCKKSNERDREAVYKHCVSCQPAVTTTKKGPCLILKNTVLKTTNTIDLCPVFSFRNEDIQGTLGAISLITKHLILAVPAEALDFLIKFLERDRVLPESMIATGSNEVNFGMKLFSFDKPSMHFIVKPGQLLKPSITSKTPPN